jgi:hypothetical protein
MGVVKPLFPHKILLLDSFHLTSIECLSKFLLVFLAILELIELEDFDYDDTNITVLAERLQQHLKGNKILNNKSIRLSLSALNKE